MFHLIVFQTLQALEVLTFPLGCIDQTACRCFKPCLFPMTTFRRQAVAVLAEIVPSEHFSQTSFLHLCQQTVCFLFSQNRKFLLKIAAKIDTAFQDHMI